MLKDLVEDLVELSKLTRGSTSPRDLLRTIFGSDSFSLATLTRLRETARALHVPGVNHLLRLAQTALYGTEISKRATIGHGVWFVHSVGTIIGGDAQIGDRVRFCGANAIGTAHNDGYPILEDDVVVGMHACVLGPVRIGKGAVIGAHAVVLQDVPPGALAVGVPAVIKERRHGQAERGDSHVSASRGRGAVDEAARRADAH